MATTNVPTTAAYTKIADDSDDPVTVQILEGGLHEFAFSESDSAPNVRGHLLNEGQQMTRAIGAGYIFTRTRSGGAGLLVVTK